MGSEVEEQETFKNPANRHLPQKLRDKKTKPQPFASWKKWFKDNRVGEKVMFCSMAVSAACTASKVKYSNGLHFTLKGFSILSLVDIVGFFGPYVTSKLILPWIKCSRTVLIILMVAYFVCFTLSVILQDYNFFSISCIVYFFSEFFKSGLYPAMDYTCGVEMCRLLQKSKKDLVYLKIFCSFGHCGVTAFLDIFKKEHSIYCKKSATAVPSYRSGHVINDFLYSLRDFIVGTYRLLFWMPIQACLTVFGASIMQKDTHHQIFILSVATVIFVGFCFLTIPKKLYTPDSDTKVQEEDDDSQLEKNSFSIRMLVFYFLVFCLGSIRIVMQTFSKLFVDVSSHFSLLSANTTENVKYKDLNILISTIKGGAEIFCSLVLKQYASQYLSGMSAMSLGAFLNLVRIFCYYFVPETWMSLILMVLFEFLKGIATSLQLSAGAQKVLHDMIHPSILSTVHFLVPGIYTGLASSVTTCIFGLSAHYLIVSKDPFYYKIHQKTTDTVLLYSEHHYRSFAKLFLGFGIVMFICICLCIIPIKIYDSKKHHK